MKKILMILTLLFAVLSANAITVEDMKYQLRCDGYTLKGSDYTKKEGSTIYSININGDEFKENKEVKVMSMKIYLNPNESGNIYPLDESPVKYFPEFFNEYEIFPQCLIIRGGEGKYSAIVIVFSQK